jgi:hypothetical protein
MEQVQKNNSVWCIAPLLESFILAHIAEVPKLWGMPLEGWGSIHPLGEGKLFVWGTFNTGTGSKLSSAFCCQLKLQIYVIC